MIGVDTSIVNAKITRNFLQIHIGEKSNSYKLFGLISHMT